MCLATECICSVPMIKPAVTPTVCSAMNSGPPRWTIWKVGAVKGHLIRADQDPQYGEKLKYMYAPDVVQGNDGRFHLYYCMSGRSALPSAIPPTETMNIMAVFAIQTAAPC